MFNTLRTRTRQRTARICAVAATAVGVIGLSLVPAAGATSLYSWPTFECYHYSNGTATITVDPIQVNEDGHITSWAAHLNIWNGRRWVDYWSSRPQAFNDGLSGTADSAFGRLAEQPITVRVPANRYYQAEVAMASNDGRGGQIVYARPIVGHYNRTACHT